MFWFGDCKRMRKVPFGDVPQNSFKIWEKIMIKNNYYFALSTTTACNPTQLPLSHTGITNSGASGFYFAPGAPVTDLNPKAPTVGVSVANGRPERSVTSATLASAPSLPPAAMQGHVMPSFPHTLIGLGPFADLGCRIIFTKTKVCVIHPDGHTILQGWWEQDGPRLWRFPLNATNTSLLVPALCENYEEPGPRGSAADFFLPPPSKPIERTCPCPHTGGEFDLCCLSSCVDKGVGIEQQPAILHLCRRHY